MLYWISIIFALDNIINVILHTLHILHPDVL